MVKSTPHALVLTAARRHTLKGAVPSKLVRALMNVSNFTWSNAKNGYELLPIDETQPLSVFNACVRPSAVARTARKRRHCALPPLTEDEKVEARRILFKARKISGQPLVEGLYGLVPGLALRCDTSRTDPPSPSESAPAETQTPPPAQ